MSETPLEFVISTIHHLESLDRITEGITLDTRIKDLNLDSLDRLELIMAIEDRYNFFIDDEKVERALKGTIRDVILLIPEQRAQYE